MSISTTSALAPGARRPEVVAAQGPGAAERGGAEDVGRRGHGEVALDDLAEQGRPAHLADEVARVGVGAEPHVDAGRPERGRTPARCRAGRTRAGSGRPTRPMRARISRSRPAGSPARRWAELMMQWPTMASGPSRPVSARYSIGVWRGGAGSRGTRGGSGRRGSRCPHPARRPPCGWPAAGPGCRCPPGRERASPGCARRASRRACARSPWPGRGRAAPPPRRPRTKLAVPSKR